jgi:hypothetical protein
MTARKPNDPPQDRRRAERLAAALKANLKRRKAQARGRAGDEVRSAAPGDPRKPPEDGQNR